MTNFTLVRDREDYVFNKLKTFLVSDENCRDKSVTVLFGGQDLIESYILDCENDGFYHQVANRVEDMNLPIIGITTTEIGADFIKMKATIHAGFRQNLNQISEQIFSVKDSKIIMWPVVIGRRAINKCSVLVGDFYIQFTDSEGI